MADIQDRTVNLEIIGLSFPQSKVALYDQELNLLNGHIMSWAGRDDLGKLRDGSQFSKNTPISWAI